MLTIIYCCLVLHNLCEQHKVTVDEEAVRRQITHDQLMSPTVTLQRQYVVSSTEGKTILNIFTSTYYEFILYTRSDKMLHLTSIIIITNIYFTANFWPAWLGICTLYTIATVINIGWYSHASSPSFICLCTVCNTKGYMYGYFL